MEFYFNIDRTNYVYDFKDTNYVSVTTGVNIRVGVGVEVGKGLSPQVPFQTTMNTRYENKGQPIYDSAQQQTLH